jgi:hypothetical protein
MFLAMKKNYLYFYSLVLVLFPILIVLLCRHFRISTDDYYYLSEVERIGVTKVVSATYYKWSGRFAACAVMNFFFGLLHNRMHYFFLIPLMSFILLEIGLYLCIHQLAQNNNIQLSRLQKAALSLSFLALLFFMSFDIGETWFWCSSIGCYLFNVLAFVWGLFFILHKKNNFLIFLGVIVCAVFIGGSAEMYGFFFLLITGYFLFFRYRKASGTPTDLRPTKNAKLITAFIFLAISFIVLVIAPGNYLRDQLLPKHHFIFSFFIAAKSLIKFFIFYLPSHLHYIAAFGLIFFFTGHELRNEKQQRFEVNFKLIFKRLTLLFLCFLILFAYLAAFLMSEMGPARLWFLVTFLLSIYCSLLGFYAGYCFTISERTASVLKTAGSCLTFLILSYSLITQFNLVSRYSASFDEREKALKAINSQGKPDTLVVIPSLPPSGMLYSAEITGDSTHYKNRHLKLGYKLQFQVIEN